MAEEGKGIGGFPGTAGGVDNEGKEAPKKMAKKKAAPKKAATVASAVGKVSEIEKGVPIPDPPIRGKYPFDQLDEGDSFLVEYAAKATAEAKKKLLVNLKSSARRLMANSSKEFVCYAREPEENGVRCWRVK